MFEDTYRTLNGPSDAQYRDRGSKFIARAFPVRDEDEIREALDLLRKEYHDARHHCYAWILGASGEASRANDDGEPSGSAGLPILNQIRSAGLTNVLIVVVRYFGGTKLGIPGLIKAYKESSREALEKATIEEQVVRELYDINFAYTATSDVMRLISANEALIAEQRFDESTHFRVAVRLSLADSFTKGLSELGLKAIYAGRS